MATQVIRFVCADGQEFNTQEEADHHDKFVELHKQFEEAASYGKLTATDAMAVLERNADLVTGYLIVRRKANK